MPRAVQELLANWGCVIRGGGGGRGQSGVLLSLTLSFLYRIPGNPERVREAAPGLQQNVWGGLWRTLLELELLDCWPRIGALMHECFQGGTGSYLCHLETLTLGNQGGKGLCFLLEAVIRPGVGIRGQPGPGPVNPPCSRPPLRAIRTTQ